MYKRQGYGLILVNVVLLFAINGCSVYFYRLVIKGYEAEKQYRLYKQREELVYEHYQKLEKNYQESRKIVHDMKNHMQDVYKRQISAFLTKQYFTGFSMCCQGKLTGELQELWCIYLLNAG